MNAIEASGNPLSSLFGNLNIGLSDRMKKIVTAYILTTTTLEVIKRTHRRARSRFVYTIAVPNDDEIYAAVHQRILALIPETRRRSIVVRAIRSRGGDLNPFDDVPESTVARAANRLRPAMYYDSAREQAIDIGGSRILVTLEKQDDGGYSPDTGRYTPKEERILFTAYGAVARDAVMAFLAEITDGLNEPTAPRFYMARWGGWHRRDDLEPRRLDTVVLRPGQKESLVADLQQFLSMRPQYDRLGIPWHRGYLFHGPPGTGKTSLARALATHLGIDIYYLPISDLEKDTNLLALVGSVPPASILLLEDIDILHSARDRDDEADGVTMSGLLNALDGVATPAGLITIMTTNNRTVLDEALLRPGRVDREEFIDYLEDPQLSQLVAGFFGEQIALPKLTRQIAPAEVAEVLKRSMGDPHRQRVELLAFLGE